MKKRINKYFPDEIRMKLGRSYSDYEASQRRSSFESLSGYMDTSGSAVHAMSNANVVLVPSMAVMTIYGAASKNLVASPISQ